MSSNPKSKKQIIFQEAAELFRDKGYPATSMRDLAERVGLKPSSFYSHIKSKEEILQKICFDSAEKFTIGMKEVCDTEATNKEKLQLLIRLHIKVATEDPTTATVFNDEWRHLSEPHLSNFLALRRDYESHFLKIIEAGISTQEFKQISPSLVLYTIINSLRWLHFANKPTKELSATQIENDLIQLLLQGVEKNVL